MVERTQDAAPLIKTAGGVMVLPDHVKFSMKPSKKKPGLFDFVYTESLPITDKKITERTMALAKALLNSSRIKVKEHEDRTEFTIRMTAGHSEIGSALGSEFMGWSPIGTKSIMELLMLLAAQVKGVSLA